MKTASLVFGLLSIIVMIVGFFPCFGSLNWVNIPISLVGLIISIIAINQTKEGESKGNAVAGLVMCIIAIVFGIIRLTAGGGVV